MYYSIFHQQCFYPFICTYMIWLLWQHTISQICKCRSKVKSNTMFPIKVQWQCLCVFMSIEIEPNMYMMFSLGSIRHALYSWSNARVPHMIGKGLSTRIIIISVFMCVILCLCSHSSILWMQETLLSSSEKRIVSQCFVF